MPTLRDLGLTDEGELLGAAAGTFPPPPVLATIGNLQAARSVALGPPRAGRMTWFNPRPWSYTDPQTGIPWTDAQAQARREGAHASGLPISTPGFATAGRGGLGHWYEVTLPDGRKYVTQKTDVGPSGVVDLNAAFASQAYPKGPQSVPGGQATARYIGADLPEGMTAGPMGGGWNTTVGGDAPAGGVGYVNPGRVGQGATTDPKELVRPSEGFSLGRLLANFDFTPARVPVAQPFQFARPVYGVTPLGGRRGGY